MKRRSCKAMRKAKLLPSALGVAVCAPNRGTVTLGKRSARLARCRCSCAPNASAARKKPPRQSKRRATTPQAAARALPPLQASAAVAGVGVQARRLRWAWGQSWGLGAPCACRKGWWCLRVRSDSRTTASRPRSQPPRRRRVAGLKRLPRCASGAAATPPRGTKKGEASARRLHPATGGGPTAVACGK